MEYKDLGVYSKGSVDYPQYALAVAESIVNKECESGIICFGARTIGEGLALLIVKEWLNAKFKGGRHQNRIDMITEVEKRYSK